MEKDGPTEQITDDNMPKRIAGWIPAATNTLRICNTYSFTPATMVKWTHLNVTFYVLGRYSVI